MGLIKDLEWDAGFFGYQVGRVDVSYDMVLPDGFFEEAEAFKLVYIFSDKELDVKHMDLVDKKITLCRDNLTTIPFYPEVKEIRPFDRFRDNYEQLERLALQSGHHSRFFVDKNFKNSEYERLYVQWVKNLTFLDPSADVLVYSVEDNLYGFIAMKVNDVHADIVLVAVSSEHRGKGIGKKLIQYAIQQLYLRNIKNVQVVTQENNVPALNLYMNSEFKIKDIKYIYHYWNK